MVTVCWSPKGGSGTTVVAAALAVVLAQRHDGALVVDLAGDVPAALGMPEPAGPGALDWLGTADAGPEALARLVRAGHGGLGVVPAGDRGARWPSERGADLVAALAAFDQPVVVDAGLLRAETHEIVARATTSLLVVRSCYLGLRRAVAAPVRPSGVILVREPGRSLGRADVEDVLGVPVVACIEQSVDVARAVDAGLLMARLPGTLQRGLRAAA
jgi:hypothetical protein